MGTTSQKLTYLNGTKQLLKDKINNLGGSIDGNTTFREYVNQLENAYDRLPKTEFEEGESVTLENTLKGKLDYDNGVVGIGQASQETTQGYNLINFSSNQGSIVTVNGDGTITLNGTSSGFSINFTQVTFEANKTYSLFYKLISGTTNAGGSNVGLLSLFGDGSWVENNVRHSYTPEANTNRSTLWVAQNVIFTNAKFQIWAYEGNTDKPYEKYSNNQASPSPNWKQPIKCVAGRNILDESLLETGNIDETTGQDIANQYRKRSPYIEVDKNQPYTLSVQVSADIYLIAYFYNNQKTFISSSAKIGKQATYVLPSTAEYMRVVIANTSTTTATNIQLEEGSTATPYLPYNTIEEVVSGINLANVPLPYDTNESGSTSKWISFSAIPQFEIGKTYYLHGKCSDGTYLSGSNSAFVIMKSSSQFFNKPFQQAFTCNIDISEATGWYIWTNSSLAGKTITEIGIYEGNSNKPYEPYITPATYQLSLGDIELNAIGNYKDELIYDVDEDKVYKNEKIGKYTFTGNENMTYDSGSNRFVINDLVNNLETSGRQQIYSNRYKFIASGSADYGMFAFYNIVHQIFIYNKDYTNPSDLLSYFANNNTYFYYIRNNLNKIEITGTLKAQVKALYNAHSNNGTTIITSYGNLPMIIKVRGLKGE